EPGAQAHEHCQPGAVEIRRAAEIDDDVVDLRSIRGADALVDVVGVGQVDVPVDAHDLSRRAADRHGGTAMPGLSVSGLVAAGHLAAASVLGDISARSM